MSKKFNINIPTHQEMKDDIDNIDDNDVIITDDLFKG